MHRSVPAGNWGGASSAMSYGLQAQVETAWIVAEAATLPVRTTDHPLRAEGGACASGNLVVFTAWLIEIDELTS